MKQKGSKPGRGARVVFDEAEQVRQLWCQFMATRAGKLLGRPKVKKFGLWFLAPAAVYLLFFYLFYPNAWGQFSSLFFLDSGDGFQNVWNIWWVNESITQLHQNPYYTNFLHYPHGVPLITQTMNIFNGLVAIPLMALGMSLVQAVNTMVLFSFVMGGVTMFWLVYYLNRSYWVSLFAGALFTFSSYHFAHAIGHLQLVSLEWLPLFILLWWMLLKKWQYKLAFGAAATLVLVILCDYYYFFYCVIAAAIIFFYQLLTKKFSLLSPHILKVLGVFVLTSGLLTGPFIIGILTANSKNDPLLGAHDSQAFSLDVLSPFIPGGNWYGAQFTSWFWERLPGYYSETSIYFGLALVVCILLAFFARKKFTMPKWINVWWIIFFVFTVLSLGPHLRVFGRVLEQVPLPYAGLEAIFPTLQISGMPVRMVIMVLVAGIIIGSFVLKKIDLNSRNGRLLFALIAVVTFIEMYPKPLPLTPVAQPEYVQVLQRLPLKQGSGVIDNAATSSPHALYAQTAHEKPMSFGYTTRIPRSADEKSFHIFAAVEEGRQKELCSQWHIRYFATQVYYQNNLPIIYQDPKSKVHIYDLQNGDGC